MMSWGFDPRRSEGAIKPPVFLSSTFAFESAQDGKDFFALAYGLREPRPGEHPGLIYSRLNNPNLEIAEERLRLWDEAEACAIFASGMAAITTMFLTFLRPGDLLLHSEPIYGGTDHFVNVILPEFDVKAVGFHAEASAAELQALVAEHGEGRRLAMIYLETPANPTNALVDIAMCADVAQAASTEGHRPLVAVDNTYLGPVFQHPLQFGADLVLYSATKYIGGHSDLIAGACLGSQALMDRVRGMRTFMGTMADAWTGWMLLRSLETLKMRMTAQMKNARYVADFLADHPRVERVYYLGHLTEDHPQHALYRRQCLSPGAMIAFDVVGGEAEAFRVLDALKLVKLAVSLGGTESLAEHPASMTHADVPPEAQARMGMGPAMIRLSVGVEHCEDIIADLRQALDAM
jgi:methionine-gamma-lyase